MIEVSFLPRAIEETALVRRSLGRRHWMISCLAMCVVGVLSADAPCHDDLLPPELCVPEARSDFGMVATGSTEATETAVNILENGGNAIDAAVASASAGDIVLIAGKGHETTQTIGDKVIDFDDRLASVTALQRAGW